MTKESIFKVRTALVSVLGTLVTIAIGLFALYQNVESGFELQIASRDYVYQGSDTTIDVRAYNKTRFKKYEDNIRLGWVDKAENIDITVKFVKNSIKADGGTSLKIKAGNNVPPGLYRIPITVDSKEYRLLELAVLPESGFPVSGNPPEDAGRIKIVAANHKNPDWLVLYNPKDAIGDLGGYIIADQEHEFTIPMGTRIIGNGYLLIFFFSGDNIDDAGKYKALEGERIIVHVGFGISKGDIITLRDKKAKPISTWRLG